MKAAIKIRSFLFLALLSAAGAHAALASEPVDDAQQQARSMLGGRNLRVSDAPPRAAVESSTVSALNSVDAQEQARQMILGRPSSRLPIESALIGVQHSRTESGSRKVGAGGEELARRMILRSAY